MIETADASRLALVDDNFEDSVTLGSLLDIMTSDESITDLVLPVGLKVIRLAQKYEFHRLIKQLKMEIKCEIHLIDDNSDYLRYAIALQDYKLCAQATERSEILDWQNEGSGGGMEIDAPFKNGR